MCYTVLLTSQKVKVKIDSVSLIYGISIFKLQQYIFMIRTFLFILYFNLFYFNLFQW